MIPIKTGAGGVDLQTRGRLPDRLSQAERGAERAAYTLMADRARCALRAVPYLNAKDEVGGGLFRDARFRRALSLGIERDDINQTFYRLGARGQ